MGVYEYFKEICKIPHGSFETEKLRDYLVNFATQNGCKVKVDSWGNIHTIKGNPKICLQAHYDMVCIGEAPNLELYEENGYLKAKNSSLGADNGVGVAIMMNSIKEYENIECLFTNDEEVGLIGANNFSGKLISKYLLNLDSEDDHEVIIGCAGGINIFARISNESKKVEPKQSYEVMVSGLSGGHSGVEIHKNIPNAIKILARFLAENGCELCEISGGERSNSIPANARAIVRSDTELTLECKHISIKKLDKIDNILINSDKILALINSFAQGVRSYDKELSTPINSINLSLLSQKDGVIELEFFARAMNEDGLCELKFETSELAKVLGFSLDFKDRSVAWDSQISDFTRYVLSELQKFRPEAKITTVHAGLECGVLRDKQKELEACSIGPNIHSPHSINERLELKSMDIITEVVNNIVKKYQ